MDCTPIPQFWLHLLLRSKTYLKENPPIANREFPLSNKPEAGGCGKTGLYTHYKMQITQLHSGLVHDVVHYLYRF